MGYVRIQRPRLATGRASAVVDRHAKIRGGKRIREVDRALHGVGVAVANVHLRIDGIDRCRRINGCVDIDIPLFPSMLMVLKSGPVMLNVTTPSFPKTV